MNDKVSFAKKCKKNIKLSSLILLSFMGVSTLLWAQSNEMYTVIKVQGEIVRAKTGKLLYTGEEFGNKENLNFRTDYSRAAVISPSKGRFIITGALSRDVVANFNPPANSMSLRATIVQTPEDVLDYFSGDILLLGNDYLELDTTKLLVNEDNYFSLMYDSAHVMVSKKIDIIDGKVPIDNEYLFNKQMPQEAFLKYTNERGEETESEFFINYPEHDVLVKEVQLILSNLSEGAVAEKEIHSYLNEFYGKVSLSAVTSWVEEFKN